MTIKIEYDISKLSREYMTSLGFSLWEDKYGTVGGGIYVSENTDIGLIEEDNDLLGFNYSFPYMPHLQPTYLEGEDPDTTNIEDRVTKQDILDVINHSLLVVCEEYLGSGEGCYD